jgi:hypothetical protein
VNDEDREALIPDIGELQRSDESWTIAKILEFLH